MQTAIKISYQQPFDFERCLRALYRSPDEILYHVESEKVYRLIELNGKLVPVVISQNSGNVWVETDHDLTDEQRISLVGYIEHWFDLSKDLAPFYRLLQSHPKLANFTKELHGLRIVGIPDLFEAICWSILGQQINLSFAHKLKRRLIEHYGTKLEWRGKELYHFPTPQALLELDEVYLHQKQQFSRSKLKYIKNVAEAFAGGLISKEKLLSLPSFEERQALLTSVKGIGIWSANYTLMKALNQPEAIPFGDTGLTQALFNHEIIADRKDEASIRNFFASVKGWEAYTVFYLWQSL